jgi:hypothetical protein
VTPALCFNEAVENGTNTVFMALGDDLVHSEETMDSIRRAPQDDSDRDQGRNAGSSDYRDRNQNI